MRIQITSLFLLSAPALAVTPVQSAKQSPSGIVEVAPLRGAVGAPSGRGEYFLRPRLAVGLGYDATSSPSERADFTNRYAAESVEAVYYPMGLSTYPVFAAAGLRVEQAALGRQRSRSSTTWARTNADESNDTWVNDDTYYSWTQSVGYRAFATHWLTASLRLIRDELLTTQSTAAQKDVVTDGVDLSTHGREPVTYKLTLNVGLWLH